MLRISVGFEVQIAGFMSTVSRIYRVELQPEI